MIAQWLCNFGETSLLKNDLNFEKSTENRLGGWCVDFTYLIIESFEK